MLKSKEIALLNRIEEDRAYCDWFFQSAKDLKWFYPLKEREYFDPDKTLTIDGSEKIIFWNTLTYLERVSKQVTETSNQDYGRGLIEIIEKTVQYSRQTQKLQDYYIWWTFVKILNNLPTKLIIENVKIEQFEGWLFEWTDKDKSGGPAISEIAIKLLGKFLENKGDKKAVNYAEAIIKVMTRIQPEDKSKKKGSLPSKDTVLIAWSSYWILDAFRKHNKKIAEACSRTIVFDLADKLKRTLEYKQKRANVLLQIGQDIYQLTACRVDRNKLKRVTGVDINNLYGGIDFDEFHFECFAGQYSAEQIQATGEKEPEVIKHKLIISQVEPEITTMKPFHINAKDKETFISELNKFIPEDSKLRKADGFERKLGFFYEDLWDDYSHIWFRSLENIDDVYGEEAEDILAIILKDVLRARCESNKNEAKAILKEFLTPKYQFPIFRRFVLYCINNFWPDYGSLLPELLKVVPDVMDKTDYEVELFDVLKNHNQKFDESLIRTIKQYIDNVPRYYRELSKERQDKKYEAHWKYKWLSSLKDNPAFSDLYNEAKRQAEVKDDKAYEPRRSAFMGGMVEHRAPLAKDEIISKSNADLIRYLKEFKGATMWETFEGKPDEKGLASVLQGAVSEKPEKFTNEIELFHECPYLYVNSLLRGFKDAWRAEKLIEWGKIFDFCAKYIAKPNFLKEAFEAQGEDSGDGKYIWVVETIADLIEDGCRKDERAFDPKHFPAVDKLFDKMLPLPKSEKRPDIQRDAVTYALNTTLGRVIMSYIIFSLRVARANKAKDPNWSSKEWGKNKYDRFFKKGIEAYIWFGRYLPNIKYLDEAYADEKIKLFSNPDMDDYQWQKFMEGYLTGPSVYVETYTTMRSHYIKAIKDKVFKEDVDKRLVQHITIGYLRGYELLEKENKDGKDSLFWKMLQEADSKDKRDRWLEVAGFLWLVTGRTERRGNREKPSEDFKEKILGFWAWSYNNREGIQKKLSDDYPSFLARLAELTILLDKIDVQAYGWLMLSAPYVDLHHNSNFFFEYLTRFEDKESIERIGKIFLEVLKNTTPTFRKEDIELIVERLYKLGKKDPDVKKAADDICNTYGRRGIHFLKDLFYANRVKEE